jgi:DNA primase
LSQDVDLRVLTLPESLDPAEFLERHGERAFRELCDQAPEALDFKWKASVARVGTATVDARQKLLAEMLDLIVTAPRLAGTPREAVILGLVSQRLGIAETELRSALKVRRLELDKQRQREQARQASNSDEVARRIDSGQSSDSVSTAVGYSDGVDPAADTNRGQNSQRSGDFTRVERAERELIQILLASPEMTERIRGRVRSEEIRDGFLRRLLEVCYQIHDNGDQPAFERVAASMEDPELKRLLVQIDEESRSKETALRLKDSEFDLVEETVQVLKWRRERESYESELGHRSGHDEAAGGLDDDDRARLRRAFEHHQKRTRQGVIR